MRKKTGNEVCHIREDRRWLCLNGIDRRKKRVFYPGTHEVPFTWHVDTKGRIDAVKRQELAGPPLIDIGAAPMSA